MNSPVNAKMVEALEARDVTGALKNFDDEISGGRDPWEIHLSLFAPVQKVLNPPFINPHLPKMYRITREFVPLIDRSDISKLVRLEISEYARRPKLKALSPNGIKAKALEFKEIESALAKGDPGKTAQMMSLFLKRHGGDEFSRRMLLLGSGYLDDSLGHSISCTAFILLEAIQREDQDPWPALAMLADYFHKGKFNTTPPLKPQQGSKPEMDSHLLKAASGSGIVNLHHMITIYAIDRVRHFFSEEEYDHLVRAWIEFMGEKKVDEAVPAGGDGASPRDYTEFYGIFARMDTDAVLAVLGTMMNSKDGRRDIGRYLIKAVCDKYQGDYNPHYLTGLGSALWVLERYPDNRRLCTAALRQYLDYFYKDLKK